MLERILDGWVVELIDFSIYSKYGEWFDLFEDSTQDPRGVFCMTKNLIWKVFSLGDKGSFWCANLQHENAFKVTPTWMNNDKVSFGSLRNKW
jgi:hypothetical protein